MAGVIRRPRQASSRRRARAAHTGASPGQRSGGRRDLDAVATAPPPPDRTPVRGLGGLPRARSGGRPPALACASASGSERSRRRASSASCARSDRQRTRGRRQAPCAQGSIAVGRHPRRAHLGTVAALERVGRRADPGYAACFSLAVWLVPRPESTAWLTAPRQDFRARSAPRQFKNPLTPKEFVAISPPHVA